MDIVYLSKSDLQRIELAHSTIRQSPRTHYTIAQLAVLVMLPEKKLKAAFKQVFGMGLYAYLRELRLEKAKELLQEGRSVKMIVRHIGYKSESTFCKAFTSIYGETPGSYKRSNESVTRIGI